MVKKFAVFGNPIAHSLSPLIHEQFAKEAGIALVYEKILVPHDKFAHYVEDFFNHQGVGLNITLPFKEEAFRLSDKKSPRGQHAKAANTLYMQDGLLVADNTDGIGFIRDLKKHIKINDKKVLLLGAGGASRGIIGPLLDARIKLLHIHNRTTAKATLLAAEFQKVKAVKRLELDDDYDIIINATAIGGLGSSEFPEHIFKEKPFCYDLSYNITNPTPFITIAKKHNCRAEDGIGMLIEQAAMSFFVWNGFMPDTKKIII